MRVTWPPRGADGVLDRRGEHRGLRLHAGHDTRERRDRQPQQADARDDGKRKLAAALHRNTSGKSREIVVIDAFTGAQLDLALNRPNVVHAALLAGPGGETFLARAARLTCFRTGFSPDAVSAHAPTDGA